MDKEYFEKLKNDPNTLKLSMEFLAKGPNGETRSLEEAWKSMPKGSTLMQNGKVIATKEIDWAPEAGKTDTSENEK